VNKMANVCECVNSKRSRLTRMRFSFLIFTISQGLKLEFIAIFDITSCCLQQESSEGARYDPDKPGGGSARTPGGAASAEEAGAGRVGTGSGPGSDSQSSGRC